MRELGVLQALHDDVERQREANEDRIEALNEQLDETKRREKELAE